MKQRFIPWKLKIYHSSYFNVRKIYLSTFIFVNSQNLQYFSLLNGNKYRLSVKFSTKVSAQKHLKHV